MRRRLVDTFQLNAVPKTIKTSVVPHLKALLVTNTKCIDYKDKFIPVKT